MMRTKLLPSPLFALLALALLGVIFVREEVFELACRYGPAVNGSIYDHAWAIESIWRKSDLYLPKILMVVPLLLALLLARGIKAKLGLLTPILLPFLPFLSRTVGTVSIDRCVEGDSVCYRCETVMMLVVFLMFPTGVIALGVILMRRALELIRSWRKVGSAA